MSRLLTLTLTSHRGRRYPVELFTADTAFADEGAVYLLMRLPEGRAVQAQILYVGDAEALGAQLEADKRENGPWSRAAEMGFDTVGAVALSRPEDRQMIAREFIDSWHPPCNAGQGAQTGLMGLAAPLPVTLPRSALGR
ncbi:hypothetical protein AYJ57_00400 [Salipiger sp. CCB-MM3]|uniref:hypothetical protein n=1 Tax=Roseobacteraceae TaxID=2854170 RepID=UPI00080AAFD7|nr:MULTISPECIES: hypothetical protein [Roseobacteraceae]ANT58954.1 hypothetical protein AYJ57_00400 [Salipiger sp. CCB-MM3]MCA0994669.1 hypothetical protein [Alloyangia pacifica]